MGAGGEEDNTNNIHTLSLSTGYSMSIKSVRIGLSFNTSYKFGSGVTGGKPWTATGSVSLSTSLGKAGSFSLSASVNQDAVFYATASFSISLGTSSFSASANTNNAQTFTGNLGWYYRPGSSSRNSFQVNVSSINLLDPKIHTLSASWSRSGDLVNMSLRQQASSKYTRFSTSFSLSTAFAFADGYFAMTNSINSPFFLVVPDKALKDATISVANALDMNSTKITRKTFGNVLYPHLSIYKSNNIVVYASTGSLFTSSGSFLFKATPVARQGFLAKIRLEASIAVSGILLFNQMETYDSYSSPIYKVELEDNGVDVKSMEIDQTSYFFTDIDGRFILSDLPAGLYMIDLEYQDQWYAAFFEVPSVSEAGLVALYKEFDASQQIVLGADMMQKYNVKSYDPSYAGSVYLELDQFMAEEDYWDLIFSVPEDEALWDWDDWDDWDDSAWETIDGDTVDSSTQINQMEAP